MVADDDGSGGRLDRARRRAGRDRSGDRRCHAQRAEIGYVFAPAFGGQGYATEAGHALLHLAFDELGFRRVIARVDSRNQPSVRVVERLGMRLEAHLVENEWFKGEWSDELDFALLESEWLSRNYPGCPDCPPGGRGDRS